MALQMIWVPSLLSFDYIHQLTDFCPDDQKFLFALDDNIGVSGILKEKQKQKTKTKKENRPLWVKAFPFIGCLGS